MKATEVRDGDEVILKKDHRMPFAKDDHFSDNLVIPKGTTGVVWGKELIFFPQAIPSHNLCREIRCLQVTFNFAGFKLEVWVEPEDVDLVCGVQTEIETDE